MNPAISKLAEYFEKLPGIGPRQAQRFVYYLLNKDDSFLSEFSKLILNIKKEITRCKNCRLLFKPEGQNNQCKLCNNLNRDKKILLVVEKDIDLENIEKAKFYNGLYFILGGLVHVFETKMPEEIKMKELFEKIKKESLSNNLQEIILAFSATTEGSNTARYIEKILEPIIKKRPIKISRLGHGLSTGTELEYADSDTLKNAIKNRK